MKDVLKKRLKNYYKKEKLTQQREDGGANSYYDYICIIDFEATCEEGNPPDFTHEIIEFPIVLLNTHTLEIVSEPRHSAASVCVGAVGPHLGRGLLCCSLCDLQWPAPAQPFCVGSLAWRAGALGLWSRSQDQPVRQSQGHL